MGITDYIGEVHCKRSGYEGCRLHQWRWVKLRDRCSLHELPVKLFVNSQPQAFHSLRQGDVVLITNLQLQVAVDSVQAIAGGGRRSLWARSTVYSQIYNYCRDDSKRPNLSQAQNLLRWSPSARRNAGQQSISLLQPFNSLSQFVTAFGDPPLSTFRQVLAAVEDLRATEERWFVVNARLVSASPAEIRPSALSMATSAGTEAGINAHLVDEKRTAEEPPSKRRVLRSRTTPATNTSPGRASKAPSMASANRARQRVVHVSESMAVVGHSNGIDGNVSHACMVELAALNTDGGASGGTDQNEIHLSVLSADDAVADCRTDMRTHDSPLQSLLKMLPPGLRPLVAALGPGALGSARQRQRLEASIAKLTGSKYPNRAGDGRYAEATTEKLLKAVGTEKVFVCVLRVERRLPKSSKTASIPALARCAKSGKPLAVGVEGTLLGVFQIPAGTSGRNSTRGHR